ncbi:MAG: Xaa-Pro dipeptidase [Parasphingorhabdus sp.]|jgi:Xaa-Pro dipeptidase
MTIGVGGSTIEAELEKLGSSELKTDPVSLDVYQNRIKQAQQRMRQQGISALYLNGGSNLYYFTGTRWYPSERMVGALITNDSVEYIAPYFERGTLEGFTEVEGDIHTWHEHESPYQKLVDILVAKGLHKDTVAIDEKAPYFLVDGLQQVGAGINWCSAQCITEPCRIVKSDQEISYLKQAKALTMQVHRAAAAILKEGISTIEVEHFIETAHRRLGTSGSAFCIVLFGEATSYPHGVKYPQYLAKNDMVLIDTGCRVMGYHSDITRSYVFGDPTEQHRQIWNIEKEAQAAAFSAAQLGIPCSAVDKAARDVITSHGLGPDYALPGLPHRTGHGVGLDIHEAPYIVRGNETILAKGMCFSNEPMICVPGKFGVRLEDHVYIDDNGPQWFTEPSHSVDDPFGKD